MPNTQDAKTKIEAWLNAPTTEYNAWEHVTYVEVAERAGVSESSANRHLVVCVARTRGLDTAEVKRRRKEAWHERAGRMTEEQLARLRSYRRQDPPLDYEECAVRLDVSVWSVEYNCKKHEL